MLARHTNDGSKSSQQEAEVELRHDKPRDLFAYRRHTCMHFRLFAAIEPS